MKYLIDVALHAFHVGLLRGLSFLVPASERDEWWREWYAELWHVRRSCAAAGAFSWQAEWEITAFCFGALQDVRFLRSHAKMSQPAPFVLQGSAAYCIFCLTTILVVCILLAHLLPGVRAEKDVARYQVNPGLILIQEASPVEALMPTISAAQFRDWNTHRQRYFDGFAFYRNARGTASVSAIANARWTVAHASWNLFALLGLPIQFKGPKPDNEDFPALVLSHEAWARDFGANPQIVGRLIRLDRRTVRISGVLPYGSWRLPDQPDVWLLESNSQLTSEVTGKGYVIAHLTPLGQAEMLGDRVPIAARGDDDTDLYGVSFAGRVVGPWNIYKFALFLALLALPAVTSVSMGESDFSTHRPTWKKRVSRWTFLGAKLTLVCSISYFASLDLAYWNSTTYSSSAEFAQLVSCFAICLFGLRWVLLDQRQRCPVCLRRVTHPAHVGLASRTFLGWSGTEMMCMGGHTLLHVPSLPTSWFSSQRWLYLDASWEFLFLGSGV